jgi:glutathione S-transferase
MPATPVAAKRKPVTRSTPKPAARQPAAQITLSSKNYSSWSLRGWLMVKFAGLDVAEALIEHDDLDARQEILLLSPSILVPCLTHDGITVWDTLAIGEYLAEVAPRPACCPPTAPRAPIAAPSAARCTRAFQPALGAADEPEGRLPRPQGVEPCHGRHRAHRRDLARMPAALRRPVPVRPAAHASPTRCTPRWPRAS